MSTSTTRPIRGGRRVTTEIEAAGERVPAVLLLPEDAGERSPAPATLLLHGYTSDKETMAESIGRALLGRGMASLAVDLPLHGERDGDIQLRSLRNPVELVRLWRSALEEASLALRWLGARAEVDGDRLALAGYSLGSYLALQVAARQRAVRALVLAAGGDLPKQTPFERVVRLAADPLRAVRRLDGRPLLMVNGRRDRTILPEQAERLFAAADEPKELRWYDTGHWLPEKAVREVADWLEGRIGG